MGDSDYGAAMPEALEKLSPPPEVQTLAAPDDRPDSKSVEPSKANGDGGELANADMSCNSTAEANNNINNEGPAGDSAKSNGDIEQTNESHHSQDDSVDQQSELDLRLNELADSFMELDEISSESSAPPADSVNNVSIGPAISDVSHSDALTMTNRPPEELSLITHTDDQEMETQGTALTDESAAGESVVENELGLGAPEVLPLDSSTPPEHAAHTLAPSRLNATEESPTTGMSSTVYSAMTPSLAPNRSTSPEIGEGVEKAGEYERAPAEDVVTIVVMEKNEEEEPSEEEASQELQEQEGDPSPPDGCTEPVEVDVSGQPVVELLEVQDDAESDEPAGGKPNQEPVGQTDNEATHATTTAPIDSDSSSREAEQAESSFLILGSDQSSGESGGEESSRTKENRDAGSVAAKPATAAGAISSVKMSASGSGDQPRKRSHPSPEEMNDERFAEIESLVAAFDQPEDEGGERAPGQAEDTVKEEGGRESPDGALTVRLGKVQKKRGRKSKEEKERLAKLEGLVKVETDEGKGKATKSELGAGIRAKAERIVESKLRKYEQRKSVMDPTGETGQTDEQKESKVQKARRTGGAPTRKEAHKTDLAVVAGSQAEVGSDATLLGQKETLTVVGNGKLRVHGYDRVNPQTGLPELVTVNREALEKVISEQNSQMQRMKAKLKEMYKVCDDLRKVVLTKGLQEAVLTPEEAAIPVDVTIRMAKLPPKGLQTGQAAMAQGEPTAKTKNFKVSRRGSLVDAGVRSALPPVAGASQASPAKVAHVGHLQANRDTPRLAKVAKRDEASTVAKSAKSQVVDIVSIGDDIGQSDRVDVEDSLIEQARDLVDALPKDIVRALTNGDVLTAQQRQRFIDKITMDIMKAKGVPQPKQIQEIALQVANMYPRSLVILPEGKRKSNLRRKRGETEDGDLDEPSEPIAAKRPRISQGAASIASSPAPSSATRSEQLSSTAGRTSTKMAFTSPSAVGVPVPKRRGRPPKNPQGTPGASTASPSTALSIPATAAKTFALDSKNPPESVSTTLNCPVIASKSSVVAFKSPSVASKGLVVACKSAAPAQRYPTTALRGSAVATKSPAVASKSSANLLKTPITLVLACKSPAISKPPAAPLPESMPKVQSVAQSSGPSRASKGSPVKETAKTYTGSPVRDSTKSPKASVASGSPRKGIPDAPATSHQQDLLAQASMSSSPRKVNGGSASPIVGGAASVAKKRGRPKKEAAAPTAIVTSAEELSMTPDEQKAWLREDLQRPTKEQDRAKQDRLLHNCYDLLYKEMAQKDYDVMYITEQWPALREPHHVLSIFKRLKKVHGEFQDQMRRDAPKLVTFLHERVTSEEGAELSLAISLAKPGPRYQLPEEVGVMPLLALNFDEDFSLLFQLAPDEAGLRALLPSVGPQPMIVGLGSSIFSCEYRIIIERQPFFTPPPMTFLDALELVYAAYFVFNFAYPRELSNTLEYVQRYYVGYNPHIKMVTLANSRPRIANFIKKMKDFERLDWNANNIRANSPGVPSEFERESDSEDDDNGDDNKTEKTAADRPLTDEDADVDNGLDNNIYRDEADANSKQQPYNVNVHESRVESHFTNPGSPRQRLNAGSGTIVATNINLSTNSAHTSQRAK